MKKAKLKNIINSNPMDAESIQLQQITAVITEHFAIEKLICFASTINEVKSRNCFGSEFLSAEAVAGQNSYALLIIPSSAESTHDIQIAQRIEVECKPLAKVAVFVHRMDEINNALSNGSSFFSAIYYSGAVIHDLKQEAFITPVKGRDINRRIIERESFWNHWHNLTLNFLKGAKFYQEAGIDNLAVFSLHQALQHCYSGVLRVLTGYRTNSNGLPRLLKLVENVLPKQAFATPNRSTPEEIKLITLLLKGLGEARYDHNFMITKGELDAMFIRIHHIIEETNRLCRQRISDIKEGKANYLQTSNLNN